MKRRMKQNLLILAVVLFVSAAAYLNYNYSKSSTDVGKILGESALVSGPVTDEELSEGEDAAAFGAQKNYFDKARLNRQESRDSALNILKETLGQEGVSKDVLDETNKEISAIAANTMKEASIENLIIAKGYRDCIAFINDEKASIVVAPMGEKLEKSDVAKISDIVMEETGYAAEKIKIADPK